MESCFTEAYQQLSKLIFHSKMPELAISVNIARRAIFHFVPPSTLEVGSLMSRASRLDALDDLLHCMVHIENYQKGVPDHTANQYHNQHFAKSASNIGLVLGHHKIRGWAFTTSDVAKAEKAGWERIFRPAPEKAELLANVLCRLEQKPTRLEFGKFRKDIITLVSKSERKGCHKLVCKCKPPFNSVRSGRLPDGVHPIDIACNVCGHKFELEK